MHSHPKLLVPASQIYQASLLYHLGTYWSLCRTGRPYRVEM